MTILLLIFILVLSGVSSVDARDSKVRAAFLKAHGLTRTPPGCQIDHLLPLMFNGADASHNLCLVCGERLFEKEKAERDLSDLEEWFAKNEEWLEKSGCKSRWGRQSQKMSIEEEKEKRWNHAGCKRYPLPYKDTPEMTVCITDR